MISEAEILKIAKLAKLNLEGEEIKRFSVQLSSILSYVKKLDEVDTTNVKPTSHPISDMKNRFQEDTTSRALDVFDVLKNAQSTKENYVVTKGVLK